MVEERENVDLCAASPRCSTESLKDPSLSNQSPRCSIENLKHHSLSNQSPISSIENLKHPSLSNQLPRCSIEKLKHPSILNQSKHENGGKNVGVFGSKMVFQTEKTFPSPRQAAALGYSLSPNQVGVLGYNPSPNQVDVWGNNPSPNQVGVLGYTTSPKELGGLGCSPNVDEEIERTGTLWKAIAMVIASILGPGSMGLPWSFAQMGWLFSPFVILIVFVISVYSCCLLADAYRYMDNVYGKRLPSYSIAVEAYLGKRAAAIFNVALIPVFFGATISFTITAGRSILSLRQSVCIQHHTLENCNFSNINVYMVIFGITQILLFSQIRNFSKLSWVSTLSSIMSLTYCCIAVGIAIYIAVGNKVAGHDYGSLTGVPQSSQISGMAKFFTAMTAIGDVFVAYTFNPVVYYIQDTLKSPPAENETMKKAIVGGLTIVTVVYGTLGAAGYAAFGNDVPGNFLTGLIEFHPTWLVDLGNLCVVIQLCCSYQVWIQPFFGVMENEILTHFPAWARCNTPEESHIWRAPWRVILIGFVTLTSIIFPYFNAVMALLGAITLWPLVVYYPVEFHKMRTNIPNGSPKLIALQLFSWAILILSFIIAAGSIYHVVTDFKPLKSLF